ncbi:3-deoxy-manno-octulosonate cytidylyltransferase, mitochondrial-like [Olea europaea var. sylvestris]|uniref:3-deoxy-manno-octulosonate cytidylyltransferase, mitochondrial-like n=1 Tax=Olea europaea var. sylvestris TaxID=158386 RepID=UPI000C1D6E45|nr:3-deoxy-manno-octulosonate cytidylyltransferase, mitochondrial-like [Olea europaea var. sylvestris]
MPKLTVSTSPIFFLLAVSYILLKLYILSHTCTQFSSYIEILKRSWERAKMASSLDEVVVVTDDNKIVECYRGFGADVILTSESCQIGTEHCNEVHQKLGNKFNIVFKWMNLLLNLK